MYKHRQGRAVQIAGFEKEQAMRVARDQAKRERNVARLQQQKEMRTAGYYGSQIPWVELTKILSQTQGIDFAKIPTQSQGIRLHENQLMVLS